MKKKNRETNRKVFEEVKKFKFSDKMIKLVRREYPVLPTSMMYLGLANRDYWKSFADVNFSIHDRLHLNADIYYPEYFFKFGEYLCNRLKREPKYIELIISNTEQTGRELQKISREIEEKNYSNASENELLEDLKRYAQAYERYMPALGIFSVIDSLETMLREALEKAFGDSEKTREYFKAVSLPLKKNFHGLEEREFLEIAVQAQKEGITQRVKERLKKHVREFGWLGTRYGSLNAWTLNQLFERLKTELKKGDLEEKLRKTIDEEKKHAEKVAYAKRALRKEDRHLVKAVQESVYYRTHRTDLMNKTFYEIRNLLLELAKKKGLKYEELLYCTIKEVLSREIPSKQVLQKRMKNFALVEIGEKQIVLTGSEAKKLCNQFEEKLLKAGELKGKTACTGKARGVCKIILKKSDYGKFQEGDVLVTSMTTPEMMPLLKKASAFLTDEGGITCHAAIVSRELNKPCIIGTKIATRVFKDGDVVEVDAGKGVVKKIVKKTA